MRPVPLSGAHAADVDVSIVVPFRNARRYICRCAEALLDQSYPAARYEIVMVENNSTDGSAELVGRYPRIKLLEEQRPGAYAARNRGVAASNGPILAFTDADCVPSADWLRKILTPLDSPEVALVQGGRSYATDSGALALLAAYESERACYIFSTASGRGSYGYTNNMAVRRDVFERVGLFLEIGRGADSVFVHRVLRTYSPNAVRYAAEAKVRHLEVSNVRQWLWKTLIYGRSLQQNRHGRTERLPLSEEDNAEIFNRTVVRCKYSSLQRRRLMALLWISVRFHKLGYLSGACTALMRGRE